MSSPKYDEAFLEILKDLGHAVPFLEAVFGFLCRCTDFYHIRENNFDKTGFPPGAVEDIVLDVFRRWQECASSTTCSYSDTDILQGDDLPVLDEVEVLSGDVMSSGVRPKLKAVSRRKKINSPMSSQDRMQPHESPENDDNSKIENASNGESPVSNKISLSDSYNGAVRDNYRWSQTILDLDVQIPVPASVRKGSSCVKVNLTSSSLQCSVLMPDGEWECLVEGQLIRPINKEESIWTLVPGQYVQLHLEKIKECWWDSLLTSEPKIDLRNIDATRPMDELSQEEHMKIEELMWNEERKRQGLPTSQDLELSQRLKEAWNKEGSPFLGRPYDPKHLQFTNGSCTIKDSSGNT